METKHQILVAGSELHGWQSDVNEHLKSGWTVVPGTLQLHTSIAKSNYHSSSSNAFAVVLESEYED